MTAEAKQIAPLPEKKKVPLTEAATLLADMMERIDAGDDLTDALVEAFNDTRVDLAGAVDRRIAFDAWIRGAIDMAKTQRDEWRTKLTQLETLHERFKAHTQAALEASPEVPFIGTMGKITVQKNPPALKLAFGAKDLTPDMIQIFGIPPEYVLTKTVYELDAGRLKADILAGRASPLWAHVEQGQSVRFKK